jgi:hypothetical protein
MCLIRGFYEYKSVDGTKVYYPNFTDDKLIEIKQPISSDGKEGQKPPCTEAKAGISNKISQASDEPISTLGIFPSSQTFSLHSF